MPNTISFSSRDKATKKNDMTITPQTKPASKPLTELLRMTWPMLIGVLSLMSFQLVDSIYIARLGIDPLAVVGFTIPIYQLIIGIQVGIGIATTALISQLLGADKTDEAKNLGGTILLFGSVIIAVLCCLLWLNRYAILNLMGGEPDLYGLFSDFWLVWLFSAFAGAFLYFGYSICRAHGNTLLPGIGMVITSLLNIALDPLFIFYFELGLAGAAYASISAFLFGGLLVYPIIFKRKWVHFELEAHRVVSQSKRVLGVAVPAMTSQLMPSLAAVLATSIIAQYGTAAVAAWGLGVRLEFFSIVLVLALTMSLPPMVGRLYGAKDVDAISKLVWLSVKLLFVWQLCLALLMFLGAQPLSAMMASEAEVASIVSLYLLVVPISYVPLGLCILIVSVSNAIGQPMRAMVLSIVRLFACYLPCLFIGSLLLDLDGAIYGAAVGNFLAGICAWKSYKAGIKKASNQAG